MPGWTNHLRLLIWPRFSRPRPVPAIFWLCLLVLCPGAGLNGAEREQRVTDRIIADLEQSRADHGQLHQGQPQWLQTSTGREFLGLYQPAYGRLPRRVVVLVHGMGGHADWPDVIAPLRRQLPQSGWSTLSIQMPLLPARQPVEYYGRTITEANRRIAAAVDFLRSRNYDIVVLAGYSFGAASVLSYLQQQTPVEAAITISPLAREFLQPQVDLVKLYGGVDLPLLDIYGSEDYPEVRDGARKRQEAADQAENPDYEQVTLPDADHFYTRQQNNLTAQIVAWLQRNLVQPANMDITASEAADALE